MPKKKKKSKQANGVPPPPQGEPRGEQQVQDGGIGDEAALMELYAKLVEFYSAYKPENLDEDVLTILIQFVIDSGGREHLNKKLMAKYGDDLNTFDPMGSRAGGGLPTAATLHKEEDSVPKPKPPPTPKPSAHRSLDNIRKSLKKHHRAPGDLDVLDHPVKPLEPRDLLEAFYSMHDESKLTSDTGVERFVIWAEKNGIDALDAKLKEKYDNSLTDKEVERIALRRRNLEDRITAFYMKYDIAKLNTRFTVLNIVNWTMKHGLTELNEKFRERYGRVVVDLDAEDDIDDLDI